MAPTTIQHRRTHNLLLISKLLNQRDAGSPFTLVLDSLEQSGRPLLAEYMKRAKISNVEIIFVSFETLRPPSENVTFIPAWSTTLQAWQKQVIDAIKANPTQRKLLIFDTLNSLSSSPSTSTQLPALLSSFISPTTSLLAVYHADCPAPSSLSQHDDGYFPAPVVLLKYLATTIMTTHAFSHVLARKAARERSHVPPSFGLEEGTEGVMQGLGANGRKDLVIEMEHRRKSGRGVKEWYFLPISNVSPVAGRSAREIAILLEDHPSYQPPKPTGDNEGNTGESETTFELGLTEKQKRDRDGVVLPYYDAQNGGVEGGRILYDMGSEDDFDDEEDEI